MNIFQNLNSLEISGMIITPITLKMVKFPCGICQRAVATNTKPFVVIYAINGYI